MFSMSLASMTTTATARKLQLTEIPEAANETVPRPLPLHLGKLDEALPEGGLPRGAVIEISSPYGLARASTLARSSWLIGVIISFDWPNGSKPSF